MNGKIEKSPANPTSICPKEVFCEFREGEPVIYQNGPIFQLGIVKRVCGGDEYFVWYHSGDTAARTHARHLRKINNQYAFHIIRLDPDGNERRASE